MGVIDTDTHILACLAIQHWIVVGILQDRLPVNLLDDATLAYLGILHGKWPFGNHLLHLQTITSIVPVVEQAQRSGSQLRPCRAVTGTCMRGVEFTQHLTGHLGKVVVIVDVGQETTIVVAHLRPIRAMQVYIIELIQYLLPDMVKQIGTLIGRTIVEISLEAYVLAALLVKIHFLDATLGCQIEFLAILVGQQLGTPHIFQHDRCATLFQVVHPQVGTRLKRCSIVEFVALRTQHGIHQM